MDKLDGLASYVKPLAVLLLKQAATQGIPCKVISVLRTPTEQEQKLRDGVSWTQHSRHLPQPPEGLSEAFDVCPQSILDENKKNWSPDSPLWERLGVIGEKLGFRWGGRWTKHPDAGHFEYVHTMVVTDPDLMHK